MKRLLTVLVMMTGLACAGPDGPTATIGLPMVAVGVADCPVTLVADVPGTATLVSGSLSGPCGRDLVLRAAPRDATEWRFYAWVVRVAGGPATDLRANPLTYRVNAPTELRAAFLSTGTPDPAPAPPPNLQATVVADDGWVPIEGNTTITWRCDGPPGTYGRITSSRAPQTHVPTTQLPPFGPYVGVAGRKPAALPMIGAPPGSKASRGSMFSDEVFTLTCSFNGVTRYAGTTVRVG